MASTETPALLRDGLLEGVSILLAGVSGPALQMGGLASAVNAACSELGARVVALAPVAAEGGAVEEDAMDEQVDRAIAALTGVELLVLDADGMFGASTPAAGERAQRVGGAGRERLVACLESCWNVTRAVVNRAFLPDERGGRIVFLAPTPAAGEQAEAALAGLENLARTLSIEWARYGVTPVTIAPGVDTAAGEVAAIVAYLASPAGAYFSGCLLDLRGPAAA